MRRFLALAFATLTIATSSMNPTHAQSAVRSITLSPSSSAITVLPDVAANRAITLINDGDTPYTVNLSVAPYNVQGENYDPLFKRLPGTTDSTEWVKLSVKTVTLAARETKTVPYTVTVPSATAPGGYYAVIFAETADTSAGGVTARNRVGNVLYMTVDGEVKQEGSVAASDTPNFTFGPSAPLGVRVTNKGGVHFQTETHFTVKSLTGATVLDKTNSYYVLPQTTRHITETFAPAGIAGIYKVSRSATVPNNDAPIADSWIVIVKPQIIPLVIFGLLTLIGLIILIRRKRTPKK